MEREHRDLDRHGEGWQQTRESISEEAAGPGAYGDSAERLTT